MENFSKEGIYTRYSNRNPRNKKETQLKNSFSALIRQVDGAEERICELEDKSAEIIPTQTQSENKVGEENKQG